MLYLALKHLHITCVILSGTGFVLRGLGALSGSAWVDRRWVKTVPHLVDTLLLGSALGMVAIGAQYPFVQSWLTAKVMALPIYIVCGALALKKGYRMATRAAFLITALAVYAYIGSVALRHDPLGFIALLVPAVSP